MNRVSPISKIGSSIAVLCLALVTPVEAALEKTGGGLYAAAFAAPGDWRVTRYFKDAAGSQFDHCAAFIGFDGEQAVYFRLDGQGLKIGFGGGYAAATVSAKTQAKMWFDGAEAEARTIDIAPVATEDGFHLNMATAGPDDMTAFMKAREVFFGYAYEGQQQEVSFPLAGSAAALKALTNCGRN